MRQKKKNLKDIFSLQQGDERNPSDDKCKQHDICHLHVFPSNLLICFSYFSSPTSLLGLILFAKCLTFCLMHSFCLCPSLMYYKQAVSGLIHTHTLIQRSSFILSASFLSLHFTILFHFPKNLWYPFISVWRWANETHSHSYWWSKWKLPQTHTHTCTKIHTYTLILILDCVSHFSIKKAH